MKTLSVKQPRLSSSLFIQPRLGLYAQLCLTLPTIYDPWPRGLGHQGGDTVRALAQPNLFSFLSPFSLYGLSYCMPELTSLISYCALS